MCQRFTPWWSSRGWLLVFALVGQAALARAEPEPGPPAVVVGQPVQRVVTDFEEFTGRLEAAASVDLRARVSGYLLKVHFRAGAEVKEGDVLFEIDPRPYQAEVDRAQAQVAQAEARLRIADADLKRAEALLKVPGALSREEYDKAVAEREAARAAVGAVRAGLDLARLNLSFCQVKAPISGRISRPFVDPGNLVKADDTLLAQIVVTDPMHVVFDMDERSVLRLRRQVQEANPLDGGPRLPLRVGLANEKGFPHEGVVDSVGLKLDPERGTLAVRGVLANPKGLLMPGLFVRVRLPLGKPHPALLVPEKAVGTDQGRKFLYVVDEQNRVVLRAVRTGALHDGLRVIEEGLKPEEWVVVGGLERVRPGLVVAPQRQPPP
jgi:RND family efflux transporter MFP subunit